MMVPSVLFVLPSSGGGGGANSVIQECSGLARLGVDVALAVNAANHEKLVAGNPDLETAGVKVHSYGSAQELTQQMTSFDVVVATTNTSVFDVADARTALQQAGANKQPKYAYYVQDYEPLFYPPNTDRWTRARKSYTALTGAALFAKTHWLCEIVYANHGVRVSKVSPSIDHDIYYPDLKRKETKLRIAAMLRPATPRRAPKRTVRIMEALAARYEAVEFEVFGTDAAELANFGVSLSPKIVNRGRLSRMGVPALLRPADMFLDLSDYQGFGRTGLESMACGCIPVIPILGGTAEYGRHGKNGFVVDTRSDHAILDAVETFINMTANSRAEMRQNALETAAEFTVAKASLSELRLFTSLAASK